MNHSNWSLHGVSYILCCCELLRRVISVTIFDVEYTVKQCVKPVLWNTIFKWLWFIGKRGLRACANYECVHWQSLVPVINVQHDTAARPEDGFSLLIKPGKMFQPREVTPVLSLLDPDYKSAFLGPPECHYLPSPLSHHG